MKRIIMSAVMLIISLTLLTACFEVDPYTLYDNIDYGVSEGLIAGVLGDHGLNNASALNEENSRKLDAAFENITINGSKIVVPVMICDLPPEFTVVNQTEVVNQPPYTGFMATLAINGEECADVIAVQNKLTDFDHAVIICIMTDGENCSWGFGKVEYSFDRDSIERAFGSSSGTFEPNGDGSGITVYLSESNSVALFLEASNYGMFFNLNCSDIRNAGSKCYYSPFEYFTPDEPLKEISGELRPFDVSHAYDDDAVVIGQFESPIAPVISEFNSEAKLVDYEIGDIYFDDYLEDAYLLYIKGRPVGMVSAVRKSNEAPSAAKVVKWLFLLDSDALNNASVMGIPLSQSAESLAKVYEPQKIHTEDNLYLFEGNTEKDGEELYIAYQRTAENAERAYASVDIPVILS